MRRALHRRTQSAEEAAAAGAVEPPDEVLVDELEEELSEELAEELVAAGEVLEDELRLSVR